MNVNIRKAMAAKSDQLNADDLISGPRTIRVRGVKEGSDGKIHVSFDGDDNKPWKPSKTALRCLAAVWGDDGEKWVGLHCTIYNDETVKWAGEEVGGIRVSHLEGLSQPRKLMLAYARGKKKEHILQPLSVGGPAAKWKERLFAVAEGGGDVSVEDAWAKVPAKVKKDLGEGIYDQLIALEKAAQEHAESFDVQLDDLNNAIAAE